MIKVEVHLSEQDVLKACRMYATKCVLESSQNPKTFINSEGPEISVRVVFEIPCEDRE
jgi:hypothetical protein